MQKCHYFINLILLGILIVNPNQFVSAGKHQKRLINKLFENYDAMERPVIEETSQVEVQVGLAIQQIVEIDEKTQTIVFSGWLDIGWTDENLRWDPADYGNITKISVMSSRIWTPDLMLYSAAGDSFDTKVPVNAVLYNTGFVSYLPPTMFRSNCLIDIYQFPFDEQFCLLRFGSWTLTTETVDLKNSSHSAQLDTYVANGEWNLESVISYPENIKYECCPLIYPFVIFVMHVRRRTLYFILNFVFPCVLISFMSILGFCLPPDSGEKIGLEMTTLLSIIMFSQLITGIIPESSLSVPKISIYFSAITIICTLCILANVTVLILHHKNIKIQQPMPEWVEKWICGYLAKLLRMKLPKNLDPEEIPTAINKPNSYRNMRNDISETSSKSLLANVLDINDDYFNKSSNRFKANNINKQTSNNECDEDEDYSRDPNLVKRNLGAILKELKVLTQKIDDDEADEERILNWKFAAMVIDRLCMIFFSAATFLSTVIILLTSKNFFKLV